MSILFAIHLLLVGLASAGPVFAAALRASGETESRVSDLTGRSLVRTSLIALIAGGLLGGLALALVWRESQAAWLRLPAEAFWWAGAEFVFSAVCIAAMWLCWQRIPRFALWLAAVASSSNLLYHFPSLMNVLGRIAADPGWTTEQLLDRPTLLKLMGRPEVVASSIHFTVASFAISAAFVLWVCTMNDQDAAASDDAAANLTVRRRAARWALAATALQIPGGLWLLITSSAATRDALLGDDVFATVSFALAVLAALALLQTLVGIAWGESRSASCRRAVWLMAIVVVLMTASTRASHGSTEQGRLHRQTIYPSSAAWWR